MGKRSTFPRRQQDAYDTPREAVKPLIPHLPDKLYFWEPCAGAGHLTNHLYYSREWTDFSVLQTDIAPRDHNRDILVWDALEDRGPHPCMGYIITNPPWTREILHPMIEHFAAMRPTWLLFDADWMHTKQAVPYLKLCRKIVSVGRVKWIPDSPHTGKDNCAWYFFNPSDADTSIRFFGRGL